jgi:hypothetical protein
MLGIDGKAWLNGKSWHLANRHNEEIAAIAN